jgi:AcrR family transcriptional regulator
VVENDPPRIENAASRDQGQPILNQRQAPRIELRRDLSMEPRAPDAPDAPATDRPKAAPGRPRSSFADDAILEAAAALLGQVGYAALTMGAVATRAGVSKATLYRRHKDKEALITATVIAGSGTPPSDLPPMTGSARDALSILIKTAGAAIALPSWLPILGAMFSEGHHEGGLSSLIHRELLGPSASLVREAVQAGIAQGELRPTLDAGIVTDLLFGSLVARSILGEPITDEVVDEVIATVWQGFAAETRCAEESDPPSAGRTSSC